jgi:hypothetical protein
MDGSIVKVHAIAGDPAKLHRLTKEINASIANSVAKAGAKDAEVGDASREAGPSAGDAAGGAAANGQARGTPSAGAKRSPEATVKDQPRGGEGEKAGPAAKKVKTEAEVQAIKDEPQDGQGGGGARMLGS